MMTIRSSRGFALGVALASALHPKPAGAVMFTEEQRLEASDASPNDEHGWSVAVDGDTAVVGAFSADTSAAADAGAAYVYVRNGTTWTEQQKLVSSSGGNVLGFGYSVDIDGDTIVVGELLGRNGLFAAGAAYVFVRTSTTWTEQQKLVASDGVNFDQFGFSVAVDGDVVVVGAPFDEPDPASDPDQGAAYVFRRTGTTWSH